MPDIRKVCRMIADSGESKEKKKKAEKEKKDIPAAEEKTPGLKEKEEKEPENIEITGRTAILKRLHQAKMRKAVVSQIQIVRLRKKKGSFLNGRSKKMVKNKKILYLPIILTLSIGVIFPTSAYAKTYKKSGSDCDKESMAYTKEFQEREEKQKKSTGN